MAATRQQQAIDAKLKQLQALPANKTCADCGDKGNRVVRFASVKLGVFLCNQCYAAHRQLGAHITRGKVIGMDNFTATDVELLERVGNERANAQYEAALPPGAKPPPTPCNGCSGCADCRQRLEYIADKYERKKWYRDSDTPAGKPLARVTDALAPAAAQGPALAAAGDDSSWAFFDAEPLPALAPAPAPAPHAADDTLSFFSAPALQAAPMPLQNASASATFMGTGGSSISLQHPAGGHSWMAEQQPLPGLTMFRQHPQPQQLQHTQQVGLFGHHYQPQPQPQPQAQPQAQQQQQQLPQPQPQPQPQPPPAGSMIPGGPIDLSLFFK